MAFYDYTVSVDVASGSVDTSLLTQEIVNDPVVPSTVAYCRVDGDNLRVDFGAVTLNATEKSALDSLVQNHPTETEDSDAGTGSLSRQVDPTITDDADDGVQVGDIWVNESTDSYFICLDNTIGAAVWSPGSTGNPETFMATGTSTITRTQATYAVVPGMTLTPGAGTYLAMFSSTANVDKNAHVAFFSIFSNGSQVLSSQRRVGGQANNQGGFTCTAKVTVADGQAIDARWRMDNTSGNPTVTMMSRTLALVRVV